MVYNQYGSVVLHYHLTGSRYLELINDLTDVLNDVPLTIRQNIYFNNDSVPVHFSRVIISHLIDFHNLSKQFSKLATKITKFTSTWLLLLWIAYVINLCNKSEHMRGITLSDCQPCSTYKRESSCTPTSYP